MLERFAWSHYISHFYYRAVACVGLVNDSTLHLILFDKNSLQDNFTIPFSS